MSLLRGYSVCGMYVLRKQEFVASEMITTYAHQYIFLTPRLCPLHTLFGLLIIPNNVEANYKVATWLYGARKLLLTTAIY
jgi:hypothetical protein